MDRKIQIEKNVLDLEYHRQSQLINAIVIFGTTGLISFIGTFIWKRELLFQGALIAAFVVAVCFLSYRNLDNNLKKISEKLENLKHI